MTKLSGGAEAWPRRALILALVAMAAAPAKLRKSSKLEAQYQDQPKDIRSCATCTLFTAPDGCKVVEGKVSPDGWCKLYDLAD